MGEFSEQPLIIEEKVEPGVDTVVTRDEADDLIKDGPSANETGADGITQDIGTALNAKIERDFDDDYIDRSGFDDLKAKKVLLFREWAPQILGQSRIFVEAIIDRAEKLRKDDDRLDLKTSLEKAVAIGIRSIRDAIESEVIKNRNSFSKYDDSKKWLGHPNGKFHLIGQVFGDFIDADGERRQKFLSQPQDKEFGSGALAALTEDYGGGTLVLESFKLEDFGKRI